MRVSMSNIRSKLYPQQSIREVLCPLFWHDVIYEVIITASASAGVVWALNNVNPVVYTLSVTHFAFFALAVIISYADGYFTISGTFFNPAVALAFFLVGRISLARLVFYTIAEIGGAACGALIAFNLTPLDVQAKFHPILPSDGVSGPQGMVIEAILTFNQIMVIMSVTSPQRAHPMPSLPIGFCVVSGILCAGSYTGGLQNPIIPFGPALVAKNFQYHWLYWAGAYIGAIVASVCNQVTLYMKQRYQVQSVTTVTTVSVLPLSIEEKQQQQQPVAHKQLDISPSDSIRKRECFPSTGQHTTTNANPANAPV